MNFTKSNDEVKLYKSVGHFSIVELVSKTPFYTISNTEIIESVIKSPYYIWGGDGTSSLGQTFNVSTKHLNGTITNKLVKDNKVYGFYDADKISASDYVQIDVEMLFLFLDRAVNYFTDEDLNYLEEVHQLLNKHLKKRFSIYHLGLDRDTNEDKLNEWSVYSSFEGFIFIDRLDSKILLIETGEA